MTQYVIDIGAVPDDGQGDPLRTAFAFTNDNFSQIFESGPVGSNVKIANNTITTTVINSNLILSPSGIGKIQDIVRVTDGDPDFDKYPKVILDYWGQPIRYYRRGYVNLTPNTLDLSTDGTKFDLGDFFALRPTQGIESEFVPAAQAATDVLADLNGDRSSTPRLRSAEFALLSSGPDKKIVRDRRIGIDITASPVFDYQNPNNDVDVNADNIVETGP